MTDTDDAALALQLTKCTTMAEFAAKVETIRSGWTAGRLLGDIMIDVGLRAARVMDVVRALGLPDRGLTDRVALAPAPERQEQIIEGSTVA